jgi:hypothetical protein
MPMAKKLLLLGVVAVAALILVACSSPTPVVQEVTRQVEVTRVVEVTPEVAAPAEPAVEVPFEDQWASSSHADASAEAFNHWNEDSPAEVPVTCAKCHSTPGFEDFLGADGSAFGVVDQAAPIGTVIECVACHNDVTLTLTSVVMPSGVEITGLGDESRCMQCHQGRESTVSVNDAITSAGVGEDEVSADLGFKNIHYFAAAATKYGTIAKGGYEYDGQRYDGNFAHVEGYNTCIGCHNPHTLQVKVDECKGCHTNVNTVDDLKNVRMNGSLVDYDGDGNIQEGIYYELEGLRDLLYQDIQAYGKEVAGTAIAYSPSAYPYFFADDNGNGQVDEGESGYASWTPRLLKAAYNYQVSIKDPGAFAHGGKYIIELLYDSIASLNEKVSSPIDMTPLHRIDDGHFAGSEEAFRHWDADGEVPGTCARCHSAVGVPTFLKNGVNIAVPPANGFMCADCHDDLTTFTRYKVDSVTVPSGATITFGEGVDSNLCLVCHQGRESTVSVNRLIQGLEPDAVSDKLRFLNVHYFAAGATRFGTEAKGAYEYTGQTYLGFFPHVQGFQQCTQCHSTHQLSVQVQACGGCHPSVKTEADLHTIRMSTTDFDGDGNTTEGIWDEITTYQEKLLAAMQAYATDKTGTGIVYSGATYPYFFADTNGNGTADPDETVAANGFNTWTPRLLQAAYNYQYSVKDPGAFAHNGKYIIQVLYDSLKDIGGDVTGMTRPPTQ